MKWPSKAQVAQAVRWIRSNPRYSVPGGLALLVIAAWLISLTRSGEPPRYIYHQVKRGDFLVSIVEGGTLKAVHEETVRSEMEGVARIIYIVPEGTSVRKGDLLVELDSSDLRERVTSQEVVFQNTEFAFIQAKENLSIQKSVIESNIKDYELRVEFAKTDLEKYREGDWPQVLKNLDARITIVNEELERAKDRSNWTKELHAKGYSTKSELEADLLTVKRKEIELEQAREEKRLATKYTYPKTTRQLEANVEQASKELGRLKQRSASQVAQLEASLKSQSNTLELQEKRLNDLKDQLKLTKIYAQQDGLVVYASSRNPGNSVLIEEGANIRQKQEIISLPDVSQMLLEVRVHETHVQKIKPGLDAYVTIDSVPDQRFRGVVRKVAVLPDSNSRFYNPNLKVYSTEVLVTDPLPDLKPGISGRAEIIITNLESVITVPIQAVTTVKGQQVSLLADGNQSKPVSVEVGLFNDKLIEIRSGLKEGDMILLSALSSSDNIDLSGSIVADERGASSNRPVIRRQQPATQGTNGAAKAAAPPKAAPTPAR